MKKLLLTSILVFIALVFSGADPVEEEAILLSLNVEKHVYIKSYEDLVLGEISKTSITSDSGTMYIRSNRNPWTFHVYAEKGALTEWDPETSSYIPDGETIAYTFSFNTASSLPSEKIVAQTVPTISADSLEAVFNRTTMYGASGEPFVYSVEVSAAAGNEAWSAGMYHDVLHLWLSVY